MRASIQSKNDFIKKNKNLKMKILSKALLFILIASVVTSCDSQTINKEINKEDILNDEDFRKLMFADHKGTILILSDKEYSKELDIVYENYMVVNNLSSCDYQLFDKSIDGKIVEYYKNQCIYFTQFNLLREKYGDIFTENAVELISKFTQLHPELKITAKDVLKPKKN